AVYDIFATELVSFINLGYICLRHDSNELGSSSSPERSSPVMLSAAKHLAADRDRPFAALRVTRCDCSHGQGLFFTIEPCLRLILVHKYSKGSEVSVGGSRLHGSKTQMVTSSGFFNYLNCCSYVGQP